MSPQSLLAGVCSADIQVSYCIFKGDKHFVQLSQIFDPGLQFFVCYHWVCALQNQTELTHHEEATSCISDI